MRTIPVPIVGGRLSGLAAALAVVHRGGRAHVYDTAASSASDRDVAERPDRAASEGGLVEADLKATLKRMGTSKVRSSQ